MCGRYSLEARSQEIVEAFELAEAIGFSLSPRYNIAPTQDVGVVRLDQETNDRRFAVIRWGLTPSWWKGPRVLINARCESVARKFRRAFFERRCLVPATGFYEWQKLGTAKQPFHVQQRDRGLFAFAGIWDRCPDADGNPVEAVAILTTEPNRTTAPLHNRMPVILGPEAYARWLDPRQSLELLRDLMVPAPDDRLKAYPVSNRVNSPDHDDPTCVEPVASRRPTTVGEELFETPKEPSP